jgi:threonine aldolase
VVAALASSVSAQNSPGSAALDTSLRGRHRLAIHVDGARIWNALAATQASQGEILRGASSAMVALNKIAGAPVGALLLGDRAFIDEAGRVQKMFGGLWRPVGSLAAAARVALRQWPARAQAAHAVAGLFASRVVQLCGEGSGIATPQTNIVLLKLANEAHVGRVLACLADTPVRISPYRDAKLRCVFHSGITPEQAYSAAERIAHAVMRARAAPAEAAIPE